MSSAAPPATSELRTVRRLSMSASCCCILIRSGTHCLFGLSQGSGTKMKRLASLLFLGCTAAMGADIRLGIIGTDTSHVIVFTQMFNDPSRPDHVPGARVVAAFKGGSADIDSSWSRVDKYA